MSNLVTHARRELELIGEDPEVIEGYLRVVAAFSAMGHSGGSAMVAIPTLNRLLQFQELSKLTDDPDEWVDHTEISGYPFWQSVRSPGAFSRNGGKTYYHLDAPKTKQGRLRYYKTVHITKEAS